jgi:zinc protease
VNRLHALNTPTAPPITRLTLSNGLQVLLKEIHTAPLISQWIWYRVGSRDETPGITGISHWVEHMQFKGTPQFPAGTLDRAISREGGFWNALTHLDWTTYFETLPADKIGLAINLEADRMVNSSFAPDDLASERTVIISERQGNENEPLFRLGEAVQAAAFQVHSYRHEVIGDLVDLQTMQREHLYGHYRTYYSPGNAVLAIAGDFETSSLLERLRQVYESIPPGNSPARLQNPEPSQSDERRITVEGPGETTFVQVSYHAPPADHDDFMPLMALDSLLSGPGNLNLFGESISNKTSRLYRSLVERERAISIFGGLQATIDPFLYTIDAIVHPNSNPDDVIMALDEEIDRVQQAPPASAELVRAVKQARALMAYGSERITNQGFWLGFSEMFASYDWYTSFLERLESVTPGDLQRVAQTYLKPDHRVLGVYLPDGMMAEQADEASADGG